MFFYNLLVYIKINVTTFDDSVIKKCIFFRPGGAGFGSILHVVGGFVMRTSRILPKLRKVQYIISCRQMCRLFIISCNRPTQQI
jgi:hypothetical protein